MMGPVPPALRGELVRLRAELFELESHFPEWNPSDLKAARGLRSVAHRISLTAERLEAIASNCTAQIGESENTRENPLWSALNSPFVLFVLSSLVLSGISFSYQQYAASHQRRDRLRTTTEHLQTEITFRLQEASDILQPEFTYTVLFTAHGALLGTTGNGTIGEFNPIYPEYGNRDLVSLLWELQEVLQRSGKQVNLGSSISSVRDLYILWNTSTVMVKPKQDGQSDSIWHFKDEQSLSSFKAAINKVSSETQATKLEHLTDVASSN